MPFHHYLVNQFSIAYDVYLDIIRIVDKRIKQALGRDTPSWRLLNACPACNYRLEDEPPLQFSKLIAIDGNNSLRRVDPTVTKDFNVLQDSRTRTSDIWLSPDEVNRFKDEVKSRGTAAPSRNQPEQEDTEVDVDVNCAIDGEVRDVTDGSPTVTICIERGRAAGPEERKRMWRMFMESGVFVAICRHGFLLLMCDMIQSGEL